MNAVMPFCFFMVFYFDRATLFDYIVTYSQFDGKQPVNLIIFYLTFHFFLYSINKYMYYEKFYLYNLSLDLL